MVGSCLSCLCRGGFGFPGVGFGGCFWVRGVVWWFPGYLVFMRGWYNMLFSGFGVYW